MSFGNPPQPALFAVETPQNLGQSETENAVRELIQQINDEERMTPAMRIMTSTALRLAALVENPGKSAIAAVNAAGQLTALLEKIVGDDRANTDDLPPELLQLLQAFEVKSSV